MRFSTGLVLLFCCILSGNVWAGPEPDERKTTPDYNALLYMGWDHGDSTSPCIGKPVTPECAAETRNACQRWWDKGVCDAVGHILPGPRGGPDTISKMSTLAYKFLAKRLLAESDISDYYRDLWRVGDTVIFTTAQVCTPFMHCYTRLKDRQDPLEQRQCPPIDCEAVSKLYDNGRHAPTLHILREESPGHWVSISYIQGWEFETMDPPELPEALLEEGLSLAPW